jgi:hypothetical protein
MPRTTVKTLTGQRFGKLVVIERAHRPDSARAFWTCRCDCGTVAVKMGKYLLSGDTSSCGCAQVAMRKRGNMKYGDSPANSSREYGIWRSMKSRCYIESSNNYRHYGARGIRICDRWRDDFAAFLEDMGRCPKGWTLDRKDPNGHYEPDNCRWATWDTQAANKRGTVRCEFNGATLTLTQLAKVTGLDYYALHREIRTHGRTGDEAVRVVTHRASVRRGRPALQEPDAMSRVG